MPRLCTPERAAWATIAALPAESRALLHALDVRRSSHEFLPEMHQALARLPGLTELVLRDNPFAQYALAAFASAFSALGSLQRLELSLLECLDGGAQVLRDHITMLKSLTCLVSDSTNLRAAGVTTLAPQLARVSTLQRLELAQGHLLRDAADALWHMAAMLLRFGHLGFTCKHSARTHFASATLLEVAPSLNSLSHLKLPHMLLEDEDADTLWPALAALAGLRAVDMSIYAVQRNVVATLAKHLLHSHGLSACASSTSAPCFVADPVQTLTCCFRPLRKRPHCVTWTLRELISSWMCWSQWQQVSSGWRSCSGCVCVCCTRVFKSAAPQAVPLAALAPLLRPFTALTLLQLRADASDGEWAAVAEVLNARHSLEYELK